MKPKLKKTSGILIDLIKKMENCYNQANWSSRSIAYSL